MSDNNLRFSITVDGVRQVDRVFTKLANKIEDLTPVWEDVALEFYEMEKDVFEREGNSEDLSGWPELTKKYYEWKMKRFPGSKILQLTGALKESLTRRGAPDNVTKIDKTSMAVGSSLKVGRYNLAALHQYGTRKMSARKVLRFNSLFKNKLNQIIRRHFKPGNL